MRFVEGGDACFSAKTCAPENDLYDTTISEGTTGKGCIFDFTGERNPFADYTVVYGPYRTGDVHIGNTTTKYPPGITVHTRATSTAPPLSTTRPPHFPTRPTSW